MKISKKEILENICYTELVYGRINKKLKTGYSKEQIEMFIREILKTTNENYFIQKGKNIYVSNSENNIRITINVNTMRVITVDRIDRIKEIWK